ncbi:uncharacterized protein [Lolium perenne]|uniref:uncharacterized protein n=1 Tax=Lolium perenne TaxID=4522 RepID=UPI0021F631C0|nr:uncharacterized protein LOC127304774 [Lolium perenne]
MKATYPLLASSELGIILKQHNALGVQQANAARNNSINESTRFLDKLVEVLSATCICCSLRSLPCLVQQRPQDSHSNSSASNLFRRRVDQADSDADSSSTRSTKRCKHRGPADTAPQKDKQEMQTEQAESDSSYLTPNDKIIRHKSTRDDKIKNWASAVRDSILMYNDDTSTPRDAVLIGQTAEPPTKACAEHTHYVIDHWSALADVEYQTIAQQDKLSFLVMSIPTTDCPRLFMCHPHPRFISMTVKSITDQLVGHTCLEHELCCLIIHRLR